MSFDEAMRDAAKAANKAITRTTKKYRDGLVTDEDDITGVLIGALDTIFDDNISGIKWSSSILRHRKGKAAEEKRIGADMLIHVSVNTPIQNYSKAILIQAKRHEPDTEMSKAQHDDLVDQCKKMIDITPSSFVFDYTKKDIRCASASKISGSSNKNLYSACTWTSYRFFLEFFRSPIGDPKITSALVKQLHIPYRIKISGHGDITK